MRTKILAVLLTLGFALWGAPAWADGMTETVEPFVASAEVYTEGYHAFAPVALPTAADFEAINLGIGMSWAAPYRPWVGYGLKEPERFEFELRTLDPHELGGPSVGN